MNGSGTLTLFDGLNQSLHILLTWVFAFVLTGTWVYLSIKFIRDEGFGRGLYLSVLSLLMIGLPFLVLYTFPRWLARSASQYDFTSHMSEGVIRWFFLYMIFCPLSFFMTKEHGRKRALLTMSGHLTLILAGWLMGMWFGILFLSIPVLIIFYIILYHLAQVIIPSSDPESKKEMKNKFLALFWYLWGNQYPFWTAKDSACRDFDKKIDGNYFKEFGAPVVIWTHSHQVVGLSSGIEFVRVSGPGITFAGRYERPEALVDLRAQLRTEELNTTTKDGIVISALLFLSFKIDPEKWAEWNKWDREEKHRLLRYAPILRNGLEIDREIGSFPYSTARVQAALSTFSIKPDATEGNNSMVYWDEIVVQRAVYEARLVLSKRNLNQFWEPEKDHRGKSALDEIGAEIKERLTPRLKEMGVQLMASRIVNFTLADDSPIRERQIKSWEERWEQKRKTALTNGKAVAKLTTEKAEAYGTTAKMDVYKTALDRAREIHADLPKHVVAFQYISSNVESLLKSSDEKDSQEERERRKLMKQILDTEK